MRTPVRARAATARTMHVDRSPRREGPVPRECLPPSAVSVRMSAPSEANAINPAASVTASPAQPVTASTGSPSIRDELERHGVLATVDEPVGPLGDELPRHPSGPASRESALQLAVLV